MSADEQVDKLCAEMWKWRLQESPEFATYVGVHAYDDRLDDISEEAYSRQLSMVQEFLSKAKAIDITQTSQLKQRNLLLLIDYFQEYLRGAEYKSYYWPINFLEGFHIHFFHIIQFMNFKTVKDYEMFVSRLEKIPKQVKQVQEVMQQGIREKIVLHLISIEEVPKQLDSLITASVEEHPLLEPFFRKDQTFSDEDLKKLKMKAMDVLTLEIVPSLQNLKQFLVKVYFRQCRKSESVNTLPNGDQLYQQCLNYHLSCYMTPKEVHELGLEQVEKIKQQMQELVKREGFQSVHEYSNHLRDKPENQLHTSEEVLEYIKNLGQQTRAKLNKAFNIIPKSELQVLQFPPTMANSPLGLYFAGNSDHTRPGIFYINTHRLQNIFKHELVTLCLHEGEPGHHLQAEISLAEPSLPEFLRFCDDGADYLVPHKFPMNTAYIEGWALYAESLGEELGLFRSDSLFGRYCAELLRAGRLVVDTGIHAFGWSRQKAIDYLTEMTVYDVDRIENEIDRYITWPGQACAYKVGELKIWELHHLAKSKLGKDFELREFHETILKCGAVPLRILSVIVDDYIQRVLDRKLV